MPSVTSKTSLEHLSHNVENDSCQLLVSNAEIYIFYFIFNSYVWIFMG